MDGPGLLFVYGTLRKDSTHPMAERLRAAADWCGAARWDGALWDMGAHPAAVHRAPDDADSKGVQGDLFRLRNEEILIDLDEYEDCTPGGGLGPLGFVRELQPIHRDDGEVVQAWLYRFTRSVATGRRIPHGDYLADRLRAGQA